MKLSNRLYSIIYPYIFESTNLSYKQLTSTIHIPSQTFSSVTLTTFDSIVHSNIDAKQNETNISQQNHTAAAANSSTKSNRAKFPSEALSYSTPISANLSNFKSAAKNSCYSHSRAKSAETAAATLIETSARENVRGPNYAVE